MVAARWGSSTTATDPTLDFYGWDQVAGRIRQLGLVDDPRSFVFTRYWYQSAQLAYALGGERPVLCYNSDDPRGFAFWSRPEDWIGRDGVLVLVGNEPESSPATSGDGSPASSPRRNSGSSATASRSAASASIVASQQRIAYPFAIDRGHQLARRVRPGRRCRKNGSLSACDDS